MSKSELPHSPAEIVAPEKEVKVSAFIDARVFTQDVRDRVVYESGISDEDLSNEVSRIVADYLETSKGRAFTQKNFIADYSSFLLGGENSDSHIEGISSTVWDAFLRSVDRLRAESEVYSIKKKKRLPRAAVDGMIEYNANVIARQNKKVEDEIENGVTTNNSHMSMENQQYGEDELEKYKSEDIVARNEKEIAQLRARQAQIEQDIASIRLQEIGAGNNNEKAFFSAKIVEKKSALTLAEDEILERLKENRVHIPETQAYSREYDDAHRENDGRDPLGGADSVDQKAIIPSQNESGVVTADHSVASSSTETTDKTSDEKPDVVQAVTGADSAAEPDVDNPKAEGPTLAELGYDKDGKFLNNDSDGEVDQPKTSDELQAAFIEEVDKATASGTWKSQEVGKETVVVTSDGGDTAEPDVTGKNEDTNMDEDVHPDAESVEKHIALANAKKDALLAEIELKADQKIAEIQAASEAQRMQMLTKPLDAGVSAVDQLVMDVNMKRETNKARAEVIVIEIIEKIKSSQNFDASEIEAELGLEKLLDDEGSKFTRADSLREVTAMADGDVVHYDMTSFSREELENGGNFTDKEGKIWSVKEVKGTDVYLENPNEEYPRVVSIATMHKEYLPLTMSGNDSGNTENLEEKPRENTDLSLDGERLKVENERSEKEGEGKESKGEVPLNSGELDLEDERSEKEELLNDARAAYCQLKFLKYRYAFSKSKIESKAQELGGLESDITKSRDTYEAALRSFIQADIDRKKGVGDGKADLSTEDKEHIAKMIYVTESVKQAAEMTNLKTENENDDKENGGFVLRMEKIMNGIGKFRNKHPRIFMAAGLSLAAGAVVAGATTGAATGAVAGLYFLGRGALVGSAGAATSVRKSELYKEEDAKKEKEEHDRFQKLGDYVNRETDSEKILAKNMEEFNKYNKTLEDIQKNKKIRSAIWGLGVGGSTFIAGTVLQHVGDYFPEKMAWMQEQTIGRFCGETPTSSDQLDGSGENDANSNEALLAEAGANDDESPNPYGNNRGDALYEDAGDTNSIVGGEVNNGDLVAPEKEVETVFELKVKDGEGLSYAMLDKLAELNGIDPNNDAAVEAALAIGDGEGGISMKNDILNPINEFVAKSEDPRIIEAREGLSADKMYEAMDRVKIDFEFSIDTSGDVPKIIESDTILKPLPDVVSGIGSPESVGVAVNSGGDPLAPSGLQPLQSFESIAAEQLAAEQLAAETAHEASRMTVEKLSTMNHGEIKEAIDAIINGNEVMGVEGMSTMEMVRLNDTANENVMRIFNVDADRANALGKIPMNDVAEHRLVKDSVMVDGNVYSGNMGRYVQMLMNVETPNGGRLPEATITYLQNANPNTTKGFMLRSMALLHNMKVPIENMKLPEQALGFGSPV